MLELICLMIKVKVHCCYSANRKQNTVMCVCDMRVGHSKWIQNKSQDHMVPRIKTVAENWDNIAPSAGTILAYLETTA